MRRHPPAFFEDIRKAALQRWQQLEKDPELAGPWKQLFRQVQSPRHVLSELLQNADDAGARQVRVRIEEGVFLFEHDGHDFTEEEFASLCRFGFSNKRTLYTIGFRGIGFKSTFSLGDIVELFTPTLAVRFEKQRFTLPIWLEKAPPCDKTRITVRIQDENREQELRKSLEDWIKSPASLLFFRHIEELEIEGRTIRKKRVREGPLPGAEVIQLVSEETLEVLYFASEEEPFPEEALEEIRQERDVEDLNLPPCRVELVLGLPGPQRLYTVLPTGVQVETPFSCNAPFLQDPGRFGIKDPSISPTNRWLLTRLGQLAGRSMVAWLANQSLSLEERARAYELLPPRPQRGSSQGTQVAELLSKAFREALGNHPVLLTMDGKLAYYESCIAPPRRVYKVWEPVDLLQVFEASDLALFSPLVTEEARRRLDQWELLENLQEESVVRQLRRIRPVPRPRDLEGLRILWSLVWRHRNQVSSRDWSPWPHEEKALLEIPLVPVKGSPELHPANQVVRLPEKDQRLSDEAWEFLTGLLVVMDPEWIEYLKEFGQVNSPELENVRFLLREIELDHPSTTEQLLEQACQHLFSREAPTLEDHVRMAHLLAALDVRAPKTLRCITRDGRQRALSYGLVATQDPQIEDLLPDAWRKAHFLHDAYFQQYRLCTPKQWGEWITSEKSGFLPFVTIRKKELHIYGVEELREVLAEKGVYLPDLPYSSKKFYIEDADFEESVLKYWEDRARSEPHLWARVTSYILTLPPLYWESVYKASVHQLARGGWEKKIATDVPAAWVVRLRGLRCLYDTSNQPRVPGELYMLTPSTEALLNVEPFVKRELDTEATKPLLRLLGVRDTPADVESLLDRLRALTKAPNPEELLGEILKWYEALDRVLSYQPATKEVLVRAFHQEALVLTSGYRWMRASEVFQRESEELPEVPVLHQAVRRFRLWEWLGVRERPNTQSVLDWLCQLRSYQELQEGQFNAVRAALKQYPILIWRQCGHWLTLDNRWTPTSQIKYRLTMQRLGRWANFFPFVKAATANLQMLSREEVESEPFAQLKELAEIVRWEVSRRPSAEGAQTLPWLAALAGYLKRIRFSDKKPEERQRIRELAHMLAQTKGVYLHHQKNALQATPYIEGQPAGPPEARRVLWDREGCFLFMEGKESQCYNELVEELAGPFADPEVQELFRACVARDEGFIRDYVAEHFQLQEEELPLEEPRSSAASPRPLASALRPVAQIDEEEGEPETVFVPHRGGYRKDSVFRGYAVSRGFEWDETRGCFGHPDGFFIRRAKEPSFDWYACSEEGEEIMRYWVAPKPMEEDNSLECPAEVWEAFKQWPSKYTLIWKRSRKVFALSAEELMGRLQNKAVEVFPAAYRLRIRGLAGE